MSSNAVTPGKLNYTTLPIFFIQRGDKPARFLKEILKQAELTNGKENVYLLADTQFEFSAQFNCIDIAKYLPATQRFDALYQHHSTNPVFFEKSCFDRWFIINALAKDLGIDYFFHADCDVLLAADIAPVYKKLLTGGYQGSVMFFERDGDSVTSGHSSFWSAGLLDAFCDFVCRKYADKAAFDIIKTQTLAGKFLGNRNVSDMILLDVFRTEIKPIVLNLLTLEDEGATFDFNANVSYNGHHYHYVINRAFGIKQIKRKNGNLMVNVAGDGRSIKFYTFHFQGFLTKALIPLYVNAATPGKLFANYVAGILTLYGCKTLLLKNKVRDRVKGVFKNK